MADVYLLLGSNLGDKTENIRKAIMEVGRKIGPVTRTSSIYQSPPWGFIHKEEFLNQLIISESKLAAGKILEHINSIETRLGRIKKALSNKYEARTIDIDILYYGNLILDTENLKIPHPKIQNRRFTLVPLCELNPDFIHPVLKKSQTDLLAACNDNSEVWKPDTSN